MIFMLICTEGDVSEPAFIQALASAARGQAPHTISSNIEILSLPLGGNHGHTKLVRTANKVIADYSKEELVGLADKNDIIEKWIIVDHDDMEKHDVNPEELREEAQNDGYTLVISKPNFEFFILAILSDFATALATNKDQFRSKINSRIESLNEEDKDQKGFSREMLMPKYSKKKYVAEKLFGLMLSGHPEFIDKMVSMETDIKAERYSEVPKIAQRITELYT